jgi:hypothetical protein
MATLLVGGAIGVVGRTALRHLGTVGGWDLVGSPISSAPRASSRSISAMPRTAARSSPISAKSHVLYCANYEKPNIVRGWTEPDHVEINGAMLRNLIEALEPRARCLVPDPTACQPESPQFANRLIIRSSWVCSRASCF